MLQSKLLKFVAAVLLITVTFTACKKDPFTEKDAIAAQGNLLQQMYSYQLQIAQVNASASRSHDSALIAIQVMVNSGATSLAVLQAQQNLAYLMQQYANQVAIYKLQDSLAKGQAVISYNDSIAYQKFLDSLTAARTNTNALNALMKNYTLKVNDYNSNTAIAGATVSVFSYVTNSIVTATTDANGVANFSQIIVDPAAYFYISKLGYASSSIVRNNVGNGTTISLWNNSNAQNTVNGQIVTDLDLTNGDVVEGVAGQLITFSINYFYYNGVSQTIQFATVTDANGNYSIKLPDAPSGYNYTGNTNSSITVSQKMFVRFMGGSNPFTTLPHIDSVTTTLGLNAGNFTSSWNGSPTYYFASYSTAPQAGAFYLSLPNDTLGNKVFAVVQNYNYLYYTSASTPGSSPTTWTDSTYYVYVMGGSSGNWGINNDAMYSVNDNNYNYRKNYTDTLPVTLVDLTGKFITTAPNLKAYTNTAGKITHIGLAVDKYGAALPGAEGMFANRHGITNRAMDINQTGLRTQAFYSNIMSASTFYFSLQGGQTLTYNFDYNNLWSRANNPQ